MSFCVYSYSNGILFTHHKYEKKNAALCNVQQIFMAYEIKITRFVFLEHFPVLKIKSSQEKHLSECERERDRDRKKRNKFLIIASDSFISTHRDLEHCDKAKNWT